MTTTLFLANAKDYLLRIRNHASLGIFCGRNEGFPPQPIDEGLRGLVASLEPESHYISSSADGPVSGHGPYRVEPLRYYFEHAPTSCTAKWARQMWWRWTICGGPCRNRRCGRRVTSGRSMIITNTIHSPRRSTRSSAERTTLPIGMSLAQFVDYDAYRGMFEGQSKNRLGLLIWMSHPAWPSLLWQTYDYFFDTDAGYYGAKKGAEPLHIQWNASTDAVEVVNYSAGEQTGLTARAQVLNIDGSVKWEKTAAIESHEDSTVSPLELEFPSGLSRTHFIRLVFDAERRDSLVELLPAWNSGGRLRRAFASWAQPG